MRREVRGTWAGADARKNPMGCCCCWQRQRRRRACQPRTQPQGRTAGGWEEGAGRPALSKSPSSCRIRRSGRTRQRRGWAPVAAGQEESFKMKGKKGGASPGGPRNCRPGLVRHTRAHTCTWHSLPLRRAPGRRQRGRQRRAGQQLAKHGPTPPPGRLGPVSTSSGTGRVPRWQRKQQQQQAGPATGAISSSSRLPRRRQWRHPCSRCAGG